MAPGVQPILQESLFAKNKVMSSMRKCNIKKKKVYTHVMNVDVASSCAPPWSSSASGPGWRHDTETLVHMAWQDMYAHKLSTGGVHGPRRTAYTTGSTVC